MPQGASPTGIDFTTVRLGTSTTDTSLLLPLVANSNLLVGREGELPHPLSDQQIFLDLERFGVDYSHAVGGTERDEGARAVLQ